MHCRLFIVGTEFRGRDVEELQDGALGVGDRIPEGLDEAVAVAEAVAALAGEQGEELAGGGSSAGAAFGIDGQGIDLLSRHCAA